MKKTNEKYISVPVTLPMEHFNTLNAAAHVAIAEKLPIKLIHVVKEPHVQYPATYNGMNAGMLPYSLEEVENNAKRELEAQCLRMKRHYPGLVDCSYEVLVGFVENRLLDIISKEKPEWTILPSSTDAGIFQRIFGDIPSNLAKSAGAPVMIIPDNIKNFRPRHISYLVSADREDHEGLDAIVKLAMEYRAVLEVVQVREETTDKTFGEGSDSLAELRKKLDIPGLTFTIIEGVSLGTVLERTVNNGDADMIVMHHIEQGLFERLFQGDLTSNLVKETEKPLVVL